MCCFLCLDHDWVDILSQAHCENYKITYFFFVSFKSITHKTQRRSKAACQGKMYEKKFFFKDKFSQITLHLEPVLLTTWQVINNVKVVGLNLIKVLQRHLNIHAGQHRVSENKILFFFHFQTGSSSSFSINGLVSSIDGSSSARVTSGCSAGLPGPSASAQLCRLHRSHGASVQPTVGQMEAQEEGLPPKIPPHVQNMELRSGSWIV